MVWGEQGPLEINSISSFSKSKNYIKLEPDLPHSWKEAAEILKTTGSHFGARGWETGQTICLAFLTVSVKFWGVSVPG